MSAPTASRSSVLADDRAALAAGAAPGVADPVQPVAAQPGVVLAQPDGTHRDVMSAHLPPGHLHARADEWMGRITERHDSHSFQDAQHRVKALTAPHGPGGWLEPAPPGGTAGHAATAECGSKGIPVRGESCDPPLIRAAGSVPGSAPVGLPVTRQCLSCGVVAECDPALPCGVCGASPFHLIPLRPAHDSAA